MKTPNGFTVQEENSPALGTFRIGSVPFRMWIPAHRSAQHLMGFLNAMERVGEAGWDGGYAKRPVRGGTAWSEHAAGTAFDWNASQHPQGVELPCGWSKTQIDGIRWYLGTENGRQWKWGADFLKTPDPMHFELRNRAVWDKSDGWWKH